MSEYTAQARDAKFDQEDTEGSIQSASDESSSGDTDVYGVISQAVAEQLGEYFEITISNDDDAVQANRVGETKNFGKYETDGRAVYGMGVSKELLEDLFGDELPESIGLSFSPSTEEDYENAMGEIEDTAEDETDEEEVSALVEGEPTGADPDGTVDVATGEEETVEVADEEIGLVD